MPESMYCLERQVVLYFPPVCILFDMPPDACAPASPQTTGGHRAYSKRDETRPWC